jgi:HD superfamily phosphohydrolase
MRYEDKVYGRIDIDEPVIIDLINTKSMQRLKGINQYGSWVITNPEFDTTRFEHSVGVYILLKRFNASLEEQIAGLLHDVSHTAFSHVLDYMYNRSEEQDTADRLYKRFVMNSEIPAVLEKHGVDVNRIIDGNFKIMKTGIPDICADNLDYFLRDGLIFNRVDKNKINRILNSLIAYENELVFTDKEAARYLAENFIEMNKIFWANPLQSALFKLLSDAIGIAISKKIIEEDDIFLTDNELYEKLRQSNNSEVTDKLDMLHNIKLEENKEKYDMHIKPKIRYTDPKVLIDGRVVRLSEIDSSFRQLMNNFLQKMSAGFFIRINK